MASSDGMIAQLVSPNAKKWFVQSISSTTASGNTTLNATTDATSGSKAIPRGAVWIFQGAQDFRYDVGSYNRTITSTNAVLITAGQQEYCIVKPTDGSTTPPDTTGGTQPILSHKCETANGVINVFVVLG